MTHPTNYASCVSPDSLAAEIFVLKSQIADTKAEISGLKNNKKSCGNVLNFNAKSGTIDYLGMII
ncbi:hypothetical protein PN499_13525 [Kamptonema animale CS-326]|jgi:hypothetical protein|uniref:hypothetical protein n=1 Tax=Kamptonema animale TaxID=92934 RepID=UPI00232EA315|nr:hypothetical protein [Kamptonema animale]MDB9512208.1 hypothetical protein [Kamptonema animale CS-326]